MRFLANENVPGPAVRALAESGHDVTWVRMVAPGSTDAAVLERAIVERRVLVTFDKDFGELAARTDMPPECGVVLLRISTEPPEEIGSRIASLLSARADWAGHFSVIEPGRVRMRPLGIPI